MHVTITVISLKSLNNVAVLSLALLDLTLPEMSYDSLIEKIVLSQDLMKNAVLGLLNEITISINRIDR